MHLRPLLSETSPALTPRDFGPVAGRLRWGVLIGAIFLGTALRFVGLDHLVVWHDEVFTLLRLFGYPQSDVEAAVLGQRLLEPAFLLQFQMPDPRYGWSDALKAFAEHPEHAPLYYILAKLATALPLEPITAARGVSAVFGALLPLAAFWLMRELLGPGPAPWVAALLVACSPTHFVYAQEARQYALWTLTATAATAALVRALRRGQAGDWWLYGTLCALGLWSHVLFALLLPAHAAYGWLACGGQSRRRAARAWTLAVGGALAAFSPWLLVMAIYAAHVVHYTEWLTQPIGRAQMALEWATHFPRLFVDLNQPGPGWRALLLIPLVWALARFARRAPRPAMWLIAALALLYLIPTVIPDLLFDGSRSQHVRYVLPSMLAVQLAVAWTIGEALGAASPTTRRWGAATLATLALAGLASLAAIAGADTWWSKNYSAQANALANELNARPHPLVLASGSGIAVGELISLAYGLDPKVRVLALPWELDGPSPIEGFDPPLVLTPSPALLARLERDGYRLRPVAGTWQWLQAQSDSATSSPSLAPIADSVPAPDRTDTARPPHRRPAGDSP